MKKLIINFLFSPKVLIFFSPVLSLIFREKKKGRKDENKVESKKAFVYIYRVFSSVLKGTAHRITIRSSLSWEGGD